jgi:hypothetical protein
MMVELELLVVVLVVEVEVLLVQELQLVDQVIL